MTERLNLQQRSEKEIRTIASESVNLFKDILKISIKKNGDWKPSPVESKYEKIRQTVFKTPGMLKKFRRSYLSTGWLNFPDRPLQIPIEWNFPEKKRRSFFYLLKNLVKLYGETSFDLRKLDDNLIGQPIFWAISKNPVKRFFDIAKFLLGFSSKPASSENFHLTEVQMRNFYYRYKISKNFSNINSVIEIGGGYGALAAELLQKTNINKYILVELPERLPISYFYLKSCFNTRIQLLYKPKDKLDPSARIVLAAPWKLQDLDKNIDLLINIMSFQHMNIKNLKFYFKIVDTLNIKRMYLVNRNKKMDKTDVVIDKYPIPKGFTLLKEERFLLGKRHHRERYYTKK